MTERCTAVGSRSACRWNAVSRPGEATADRAGRSETLPVRGGPRFGRRFGWIRSGSFVARLALAAGDVRVDGLVLPAVLPFVVARELRLARRFGAGPTGRVLLVRLRKLSHGSAPVPLLCHVAHILSPDPFGLVGSGPSARSSNDRGEWFIPDPGRAPGAEVPQEAGAPNRGSRLSRKARMPSRWSGEPKSCRNRARSAAIPAGPGVSIGRPDRGLGGAERLPGAVGEHSGVADRRIEDLVGGFDPVGQPQREGLGGLDLAPGDHQFQRPPGPDQPGEPLRAARPRGSPRSRSRAGPAGRRRPAVAGPPPGRAPCRRPARTGSPRRSRSWGWPRAGRRPRRGHRRWV